MFMMREVKEVQIKILDKLGSKLGNKEPKISQNSKPMSSGDIRVGKRQSLLVLKIIKPLALAYRRT